MISLFRKKKEEEPFKPLQSGRLETSFASLQSQFGDQFSGRVYDIDINDYIPEYTGNIRVPKKIQQGVRNVLDDYLKEGSEFYFQVDEKTFGLFFAKANKAVAELKVQVIRNELARVITTLKKDNTPISARSEGSQQKPEIKKVAEKSVLRDRGTLSSSPDEKEMREWASRAIANMSSGTGALNFHADIDRMAEMVKISYFPLWYVKNRIISGYALQTGATLTHKTYDEQRGHEDLAVLGAAARQLSEMRAREAHALLVVPVHIHTICDKRTSNLYNIYCRTIGPDLQRFIVLQLVGVGERSLIISDWEALRSLQYHCRSMIIDTGPARIAPEDLCGLKFHTFGFSLQTLPQPEDQLFMHLENYAAYYQSRKKEVFLMGVDSNSLLAAALGAGYGYVAGDAIAAPLAVPRSASFMEYGDVYKEFLQ